MWCRFDHWLCTACNENAATALRILLDQNGLKGEPPATAILACVQDPAGGGMTYTCVHNTALADIGLQIYMYKYTYLCIWVYIGI